MCVLALEMNRFCPDLDAITRQNSVACIFVELCGHPGNTGQIWLTSEQEWALLMPRHLLSA